MRVHHSAAFSDQKKSPCESLCSFVKPKFGSCVRNNRNVKLASGKKINLNSDIKGDFAFVIITFGTRRIVRNDNFLGRLKFVD